MSYSSFMGEESEGRRGSGDGLRINRVNCLKEFLTAECLVIWLEVDRIMVCYLGQS